MHSVGHLPADSEIDTRSTMRITTTSKPSGVTCRCGASTRGGSDAGSEKPKITYNL